MTKTLAINEFSDEPLYAINKFKFNLFNKTQSDVSFVLFDHFSLITHFFSFVVFGVIFTRFLCNIFRRIQQMS